VTAVEPFPLGDVVSDMLVEGATVNIGVPDSVGGDLAAAAAAAESTS
jgi:hypothetical protein